LEFNAGIKPIVHVVIAKSALTHTNCGKTDHSMGTCHKKKIPVVPVVTIESTKLVARTKTQPVK
jgi:hypothetical protein